MDKFIPVNSEGSRQRPNEMILFSRWVMLWIPTFWSLHLSSCSSGAGKCTVLFFPWNSSPLPDFYLHLCGLARGRCKRDECSWQPWEGGDFVTHVFKTWGHKELLLRTGRLLSRTGASDGINCTWLSLVVDNAEICLWFMGKQENCTFVESSLSLSGWRGLESNNSFIKSSLFSGRGERGWRVWRLEMNNSLWTQRL